jgi:predicted small secreted protein
MNKIQYLLLSLLLITVSGCGTMGGAVSGAGQDLSRAGEWIRSR